jgi:hypothetical protein
MYLYNAREIKTRALKQQVFEVNHNQKLIKAKNETIKPFFLKAIIVIIFGIR